METIKKLFVMIEIRDQQVMEVTYQLLALAQQLKQQYKSIDQSKEVVAVVMGHQVSWVVDECYRYGADSVLLVDDKKLQYPSTQHTTRALVTCVEKHCPEVLLIGATVVGRDVAPRVAASVRTGLTADAVKVEVDSDGLLLMTRPAFGGNLYATIICPDTYPQMSSIRPDVFEKHEYLCEFKEPEVVEVLFDEVDQIEVLERIERKSEGPDLRKANVILAAGRSMADYLPLVEKTAELMNASLAASRGLVETGKVSSAYQVGQTGVTVKPSIYIACGISGALQHTAGMDQSQTIIAINNDPDAPIFGVSTLGIVGDAIEVLEAVQKHL